MNSKIGEAIKNVYIPSLITQVRLCLLKQKMESKQLLKNVKTILKMDIGMEKRSINADISQGIIRTHDNYITGRMNLLQETRKSIIQLYFSKGPRGVFFYDSNKNIPVEWTLVSLRNSWMSVFCRLKLAIEVLHEIYFCFQGSKNKTGFLMSSSMF